MKTWKLVSGIMSIVFSGVIFFQSMLVGISDALESSSSGDGSKGVLVALFMIAGGIVSIATRKGGKGGNVAVLIIFALAAMLGFTATKYGDLIVWAVWCAVCALLGLVSLIRSKKTKKQEETIEN